MNRLIQLISNPLKIIRYGFRQFDEDVHAKKCFERFGKTQLPTVDIRNFIKANQTTISSYSFLEGTSLITDFVLLKSLATNFQDCEYLEIGSWRGESISNVASVAKECTSVTLSAEQMRKLNFGEAFIKNHGLFSKNISNIKLVEANSHEFDFNSLNKKFDLIFIDGDHTFEGVVNDTKKVFNLRKNNKSVIVWHDYGNSTETVRSSVLHGILNGVPTDRHKHLYHVSNTMCAIYLEDENVKSNFISFPSTPDKIFTFNVQIDDFTA